MITQKKFLIAEQEFERELFGSFDENIKLIEDTLSIDVILREGNIVLMGEEKNVDLAYKLMTELQETVINGKSLDRQSVTYSLSLLLEGSEMMIKELDDVIVVTKKGKAVQPKTLGQKKYIELINQNDITFGIGPAGTGKTYLAVAMAVSAFKKDEVSRIVLTRPAVEAGESLGFLPGDLKDKVDPYLRPLYDALFDMLGGERVNKFLERGTIEVAPLAFMRGRTLEVGDPIVAGVAAGKVRAMINAKGKRVKQAGPSTAVEILGLSEVPLGGDQFVAVPTDKIARSVSEKRQLIQREEMLKSSQRMSLDDLFNQMNEGQVKDLNVVIKADVQGSVQAVKQSLEKLSTEEVSVRVIHGGVGAINESDVLLAAASNAIIIGFNVRPVSGAESLADKESVDIRTYTIIYKAIEDIQAAMSGLLDPELRDEDTGKAEIREVYKISGVGAVAGCYVTSGKIYRNCKVRIVRDGIIIQECELLALKRFKDDVKEVNNGYECGMSFVNYNDIKVGDIVEAYVQKEVKREL